MTQTVTLKGLTCEACVKLITKKFMNISGVASVHVTLDGQAHIEASRAVPVNEYKQALIRLHYKIVSVT